MTNKIFSSLISIQYLFILTRGGYCQVYLWDGYFSGAIGSFDISSTSQQISWYNGFTNNAAETARVCSTSPSEWKCQLSMYGDDNCNNHWFTWETSVGQPCGDFHLGYFSGSQNNALSCFQIGKITYPTNRPTNRPTPRPTPRPTTPSPTPRPTTPSPTPRPTTPSPTPRPTTPSPTSSPASGSTQPPTVNDLIANTTTANIEEERELVDSDEADPPSMVIIVSVVAIAALFLCWGMIYCGSFYKQKRKDQVSSENESDNDNQNTSTNAQQAQKVPVSNTIQPQIIVLTAQHAPSNTLPHGWTQKYTPDGRVYFQNEIDKTTQWEPPHNTSP